MKRLLAGLLLGFLGLSVVVHPLVHGLESDPSACAIMRSGCENPAALPQVSPALAPDPAGACDFQVFLTPVSQSQDVPPVSRGPPQA